MAFKHKFCIPLSDTQINELLGYIQAMQALQVKIMEITQNKPENRFIDSTILLDDIVATVDELQPILKEAGKRFTGV